MKPWFGSLLLPRLSLIVSAPAVPGSPVPSGIKVSANHRFLVTEGGTPFVYLGDTAWALFSSLKREEASIYLEKRRPEGFTVIQAALTFSQTNTYAKFAFQEDNDKIANYYHHLPTKPIMDGEPSYEWHPVDFDVSKGRISPHDLRTFAYWEVLAGACGFTYGHFVVFPFAVGGPRGTPRTGMSEGWRGALDAPSAQQMEHLKALVLCRAYLDRVPD